MVRHGKSRVVQFSFACETDCHVPQSLIDLEDLSTVDAASMSVVGHPLICFETYFCGYSDGLVAPRGT